MTEDELQQIRNRCASATPGPWRWGDWDTYFESHEPEDMLERMTLERCPELPRDASGLRESKHEPKRILALEEPMDSYADAVFIMHAREDVEGLLAEIDRLRSPA